MTGSIDYDTDLPSPERTRWRLAKTLEPDVQKLVVSAFGGLSAARALLLHANDEGGAWIAALQRILPATVAGSRGGPALALAFTSLGLEQAGLDPAIVAQFSVPFIEGMMQGNRRGRLGDKGEAVRSPFGWGLRADKIQQEKSVAAETGSAELDAVASATDQRGMDIHAIALLYDKDHKSLDALVARLRAELGTAVTVLKDKVLDLNGDNVAKSREHFGFMDGISQPIPYGAHTRNGDDGEMQPDPIHGVPLGEILLGYPDAHANTTRGPFLPGKRVNEVFVPMPPGTTTTEALEDAASLVLHDLVRNGTYLVVRELDQDVKGFWDSMRKAAAPLGQSADWLAERVVGRTRNGDLLRPQGPLAATPEGPDNDFLFFVEDRNGSGCPMGSHIRRANPRDGLSPKPAFCDGLLRSANAHRILRRGRKYGGSGIANAPPKGDEGLLFMCLNTDIARQFEFVQQNWMLNPNFSTLFDEVDPLVGPKGKMTLPDKPVRRRVEVETFVKLVGGDYFFLPGVETLRILSSLPPWRPPQPAAP